MTRLQPVDWRTIRDALWSWFADYSGVETVWGNQSAPQPAYPYASLTIIGAGPSNMGVHAYQGWGSDGSLSLVEQRELVLSCQIHVGPCENTNPDFDAVATMESVLASLSAPDVIERLRQANLALRDKGGMQTLDLVVGSDWISRQQVDLRFGFASVLTPDSGLGDDTGYFDKVEVSSTIDGIKNPGGSLELDEKILDPNA